MQIDNETDTHTLRRGRPIANCYRCINTNLTLQMHPFQLQNSPNGRPAGRLTDRTTTTTTTTSEAKRETCGAFSRKNYHYRRSEVVVVVAAIATIAAIAVVGKSQWFGLVVVGSLGRRRRRRRRAHLPLMARRQSEIRFDLKMPTEFECPRSTMFGRTTHRVAGARANQASSLHPNC